MSANEMRDALERGLFGLAADHISTTLNNDRRTVALLMLHGLASNAYNVAKKEPDLVRMAFRLADAWLDADQILKPPAEEPGQAAKGEDKPKGELDVTS